MSISSKYWSCSRIFLRLHVTVKNINNPRDSTHRSPARSDIGSTYRNAVSSRRITHARPSIETMLQHMATNSRWHQIYLIEPTLNRIISNAILAARLTMPSSSNASKWAQEFLETRNMCIHVDAAADRLIAQTSSHPPKHWTFGVELHRIFCASVTIVRWPVLSVDLFCLIDRGWHRLAVFDLPVLRCNKK